MMHVVEMIVSQCRVVRITRFTSNSWKELPRIREAHAVDTRTRSLAQTRSFGAQANSGLSTRQIKSREAVLAKPVVGVCTTDQPTFNEIAIFDRALDPVPNIR